MELFLTIYIMCGISLLFFGTIWFMEERFIPWLYRVSPDYRDYCERVNDILAKVPPEVIIDLSKIDWPLLHQQKICLLNKMHLMDEEGTECVEGLVGLIDYIQDFAASRLGDDKVFPEAEKDF